MLKLLAKFAKNDAGATAIEYGLIAAGISVAILTVVGTLGTSLNTTFLIGCDRDQVRPGARGAR